jgi:hypothetical protein
VRGDFQLEHEMTAPAREWLAGQGLELWEEYPTGAGICDLVGAEIDQVVAEARRRSGQRKPVRDVERLRLLDAIPWEAPGVPSSRLQYIVGSLGARLDADLRWLEEAGCITATSGHFVRIGPRQPVCSRLVAVELKLSRVGEALHQAHLRGRFADESYVGLPTPEAQRVGAASNWAHRFRESGVGLLALSPFSCDVVIPPPRRHATDPVLRAWCTERFWARERRPTTQYS